MRMPLSWRSIRAASRSCTPSSELGYPSPWPGSALARSLKRRAYAAPSRAEQKGTVSLLWRSDMIFQADFQALSMSTSQKRGNSPSL